MKNIKKYLCAIVMMVISMTAFAQEDVFSGDWLGANKEGDLKKINEFQKVVNLFGI
mgnify:CR=1 FL=1